MNEKLKAMWGEVVWVKQSKVSWWPGLVFNPDGVVGAQRAVLNSIAKNRDKKLVICYGEEMSYGFVPLQDVKLYNEENKNLKDQKKFNKDANFKEAVKLCDHLAALQKEERAKYIRDKNEAMNEGMEMDSSSSSESEEQMEKDDEEEDVKPVEPVRKKPKLERVVSDQSSVVRKRGRPRKNPEISKEENKKEIKPKKEEKPKKEVKLEKVEKKKTAAVAKKAAIKKKVKKDEVEESVAEEEEDVSKEDSSEEAKPTKSNSRKKKKIVELDEKDSGDSSGEEMEFPAVDSTDLQKLEFYSNQLTAIINANRFKDRRIFICLRKLESMRLIVCFEDLKKSRIVQQLKILSKNEVVDTNVSMKAKELIMFWKNKFVKVAEKAIQQVTEVVEIKEKPDIQEEIHEIENPPKPIEETEWRPCVELLPSSVRSNMLRRRAMKLLIEGCHAGSSLPPLLLLDRLIEFENTIFEVMFKVDGATEYTEAKYFELVITFYRDLQTNTKLSKSFERSTSSMNSTPNYLKLIENFPFVTQQKESYK